MTIRAVILGLLLGGVIAAVTFFNDMIISQTALTGRHIPPSIFGVLFALALLANPLWWLVRRKALVGSGEMLIITAIGLATCAWPGGHLMRFAPQVLVLPTWFNQTRPAWQAQNVLAYVPGGAATLAPGHVRDWPELARRVIDEARADPASLPGRLWAAMSQVDRQQLAAAVGSEEDSSSAGRIASVVNRALERAPPADADFAVRPDEQESDRTTIIEAHHARANRAALAALWPELVLPAPRGGGVIVNADYARPSLTARYVQGAEQVPSLFALPWRHWIGALTHWGLLIGGIGIGTLCLGVIVHPQWHRRELLPYPIARFAVDLAQRSQGHALPDVARHRLFRLGFILVFCLHMLTVANAWFPSVPTWTRQLDFSSLRQLFPYASQVMHSNSLFQPRVLLTVMAFSYFLRTEVSFSLGISHWIYVFVTAWFIQWGYQASASSFDPVPGTMFRFGTYLALTFLIIYSGRRYFRDVLLAAIHIRPNAVPASARWAARIFALVSLIAIVTMYRMGLDPVLSVIFVALAYIAWLCAGRIVAETGFFLLQVRWLPIGVLIGLLGYEAIGPTNAIILALASTMFFTSINEALLPHLLHGMYCADHADRNGAVRVSPWLGVMLTASLVICAVATIWVVHTHGVSSLGDYNRVVVPAGSFQWLTTFIAELSGKDQLFSATAMTASQRLGAIAADGTAIASMLAGVVLLFILAQCRQRLAWWPLHPVVLLVMGTWSAGIFSFSMLIGWGIKFLTVRLAGVRTYHAGRALMVGVIAAEIAVAGVAIVIGTIHYFATGMPPPTISLLVG